MYVIGAVAGYTVKNTLTYTKPRRNDHRSNVKNLLRFEDDVVESSASTGWRVSCRRFVTCREQPESPEEEGFHESTVRQDVARAGSREPTSVDDARVYIRYWQRESVNANKSRVACNDKREMAPGGRAETRDKICGEREKNVI